MSSYKEEIGEDLSRSELRWAQPHCAIDQVSKLMFCPLHLPV